MARKAKAKRKVAIKKTKGGLLIGEKALKELKRAGIDMHRALSRFGTSGLYGSKWWGTD